MITYQFKNIEEFVSYLDTKAKDRRTSARQFHARSHTRARLEAEAAAHESIAAIVRSSNLEVPGGLIRASR